MEKMVKNLKDFDPEVTVAVVTLNAQDTLERCLNSIYAQRSTNIEIIVIDGHSVDKTVEILRRNTNRLKYWESKFDRGIYDAMNKAINIANTKWIYFLGADDQLLPDFSDFIKMLKDEKMIYYGNVLAGDKVRLGKLNHYQIAKLGIYHQAIVFPLNLIKNIGYDLQYQLSADHALILNLAGKKEINLNI